MRCDARGDVILRQGASQDALYIVIGGEVAAHSQPGVGKRNNQQRGSAGRSLDVDRQRGAIRPITGEYGGDNSSDGNPGGDSLRSPLLLDDSMEDEDGDEESARGAGEGAGTASADSASALSGAEAQVGHRVEIVGGGEDNSGPPLADERQLSTTGPIRGGGGGSNSLLHTGRWFGFDTAAIDTGQIGTRTDGVAPATYIAASTTCALLTVSRDALAACIVGEAVSSSLRAFFGGGESSASDSDDSVGSEAEHGHVPIDGHVSSTGDGGGGVLGVASAEAAAAATKAAERLTPQALLVASGAANAVLHSAMGSHPLDIAVQLAGLRVIRQLASAPCGEATRKELGALGALDRVAVAACVAGAEVGVDVSAAGAGEEAVMREQVTHEAAQAMKALVDGCEQNMRHALSLGCGEMVW